MTFPHQSFRTDPRANAARFKALHQPRRPLLLPNAWDVASALIFQEAGFKAIGTTSAGMAAVHGYRDGEQLPFETLLQVVRRMAACTALPLSIDLEAGFGSDVDTVTARVRAVCEAGAVGINIQDGRKDGGPPLRSVEEQVAILRAIRAETEGFPLFVNARTDTYWLRVGEEGERLGETLRRLEAYAAAGADGVFVPGLTLHGDIAEVVSRVALPLNVLTSPRLPPLPHLMRLGVARISMGSSMFRSCYGYLRRPAAGGASAGVDSHRLGRNDVLRRPPDALLHHPPNPGRWRKPGVMRVHALTYY